MVLRYNSTTDNAEKIPKMLWWWLTHCNYFIKECSSTRW